jgi:hypothetical protein
MKGGQVYQTRSSMEGGVGFGPEKEKFWDDQIQKE